MLLIALPFLYLPTVLFVLPAQPLLISLCSQTLPILPDPYLLDVSSHGLCFFLCVSRLRKIPEILKSQVRKRQEHVTSDLDIHAYTRS